MKARHMLCLIVGILGMFYPACLWASSASSSYSLFSPSLEISFPISIYDQDFKNSKTVREGVLGGMQLQGEWFHQRVYLQFWTRGLFGVTEFKRSGLKDEEDARLLDLGVATGYAWQVTKNIGVVPHLGLGTLVWVLDDPDAGDSAEDIIAGFFSLGGTVYAVFQQFKIGATLNTQIFFDGTVQASGSSLDLQPMASFMFRLFVSYKFTKVLAFSGGFWLGFYPFEFQKRKTEFETDVLQFGFWVGIQLLLG